MLLLVGAGLFVRSVGQVRRLDLGLDVDRLVRQVPREGPAEGRAGAGRSADPRHASDAGRDSLPSLPGGGPYYYDITPGYFAAVGLRVRSGRDIEEGDGPGAPPRAACWRTWWGPAPASPSWAWRGASPWRSSWAASPSRSCSTSRPGDPLVLAVVAATLVAVGLAASVLPGLRATRVDPMDALRVE